MMIKAIEAAKYMVKIAGERDIYFSNLHLQKMLYYAQVTHYILYSEFLFDDDFEAWQYGPVIPDVYKVFSKYGASYIDPAENNLQENIQEEQKVVLKNIIFVLAQLDPWQLVNATHQQSPWKKNYSPYIHRVISKEDIKCFANGKLNHEETIR